MNRKQTHGEVIELFHGINKIKILIYELSNDGLLKQFNRNMTKNGVLRMRPFRKNSF
jgi:hypothetical protein